MKALSIRQPWAWLIVNGLKDIENRSRRTHFRGRILVHASKTMTRGDYEACALFCSSLPEGALPAGVEFPTFESLQAELGGIVGEVEIVDCVEDHASPWFCGWFGYVLRDARKLPFRPCKGALNFFEVAL